jgi:ATPase family associated with various cellular activities (AAA)
MEQELTYNFNVSPADLEDWGCDTFSLLVRSEPAVQHVAYRFYNSEMSVQQLTEKYHVFRKVLSMDIAEGSEEYVGHAARPGVPGTHLVHTNKDSSRPGSRLHVRVGAQTEEGLREHLAWLTNIIPLRPTQPVTAEQVRVTYVYQTPNGVRTNYRYLSAPTWADVRQNYETATAPKLAALTKLQLETVAGHFGVLHGPPGTGKTSYLRALMQEWREQANFLYPVDPVVLFNDASYMMEVLMNSRDNTKWNVLLVEDAEKFIGPEAKKEASQAVSSLLNLGDGLLGQGLQLVILFTTNEPLTNLHPAVVRKGRTFANIEVPLLSAEQGTAWLGKPVEAPISLADLYDQRAEATRVAAEQAAAAATATSLQVRRNKWRLWTSR